MTDTEVIMTNWLLQHLRLSFIATSDPAGPMLSIDDSESLFADLWNAQVDLEEKKRNGSVRKRQAEFSTHRVEVVEQLNRIDIMWMSKSSLEMASLEGNVADAALAPMAEFKSFLEVFTVLSNKLQNVSRIAIGGISYIPTQNVNESYEILASFLPKLNIVFGEVSDFAIQLNRPLQLKLSEILSIKLNRICSLASMSSKILAGTNPESVSEIQANYWTQIQFDINTDAGNRISFSSEERQKIENELIEGILYVINEKIH